MKKIFVFGSNLAGIHGAGSALHARQKYGAELGVGVGRTGDAYAIPTKDFNVYTTLSLRAIKGHVDNFLIYAEENPDLEFHVVAIGCGLAGYTPMEIAPFFAYRTPNVILPPEFEELLKDIQGK